MFIQLQDYPQVQDAVSEYFPQCDKSSSITPWQPLEYTDISPTSSYSNNFNGEIEFVDDLNGGNLLNLYGNDPVTTLQGFDQINSMTYPRYF